MNHDQDAAAQYPHGRGYGHDYMRGGEVLGGYGYAEREEYAKRRGELMERGEQTLSTDNAESNREART
ncbi:MAG: hypothetical protein ABIR92_08585 [Gemmatimonadaceae bacterium]